MKLRRLLFTGLLLASINSLVAYAEDTFKPVVTTDKKVAEYFHKLLPTRTINVIYTTPNPDTYALQLESNILYGNLKSDYLAVGHLFNPYDHDDITDNLQKLTTQKNRF